ncbi:putative disease resistance protein At1g50180 isoform X3 [Quercus robur]|uniref:putative disease resistance protein At1g50180 isoform X3 n=1 Tax=Quercus robur TaxID=38942 RepID=UPI002162702D|nr:putative disease resistance protein At1g50180 isoform X3 [Quercus robur]
MAVSVVSGVVTSLGDLLLQEAIYLIDVSDKAHELQTELIRMQFFLKDADAKQNESAFIKNGVAEMKDLAYDAEDVIATYALTVASRKGRGIQKVLKRCACILDEGITVHQVGAKIDAIKKRISNLKQSFQEYGIIRESTMQAGGPSSLNEREREQRQTFSHLQHEVVGFDNNLNELMEFLLKEEEGKRVASICGMGGLGKTTLAKMVYNDPKVKLHFEHRAWACISQQCQRRLVWEDILISLRSADEKEKKRIRKLTVKEIVEELCEVQKKRKCLVILDDIWDVETWNHLLGAFSGNDTKSKILLTSRNEKVHLHVDPGGFLYKLQHLDETRSLELLEKIAISRREDSMAKTCMKQFGKEMIDYCGGLPLAITVLGGLLATKQTLGEWQDVLKHAKSYLHVEDSRVNNVLALSYNDLPSHLKPCFLYLGHFPEDFEIQTKKLIRMWMGEGFISQIQHRGGREDTMDDVGDRYLRELVQRCMVLVGKEGSLGRIKTCRMHDLMRDFCVSKAQDENFLHFTNTLSMKQREVQVGKVRRLAIISESGDNSIKRIKFNEYPYLRSLLYLLPPSDKSVFNESCFKKFKLVRVLHLEYFIKHPKKLPKDIGCLIHLRYLSLRGSNINEVPSSIGNLRCLETLDLRIRYFTVPCMHLYTRVPNVFKYMKQLKHLYLPYEYWVCGKLELANLSYLHTLVNVQPTTIQIPTWFKLNRLRVLKVRNKYNKWAPVAMQMLISRCPLIEKLNLNYRIKKLPEAHQFSPNLAKLTLWKTSLEEDPMPTLEKLPNLKILRLLPPSFVRKDMVCSKGGFPLLQYLLLVNVRYLEEWRVEEGAMPSLSHLTISYCYELKTIPDGMRFVTTLRELEIRGMRKSFKDRLGEGGPDFDKVQHVPSLVFDDCDRD